MQLETERLHGAGAPGTLSTTTDTSVDAELTIAEQEALLGWLAEVEDEAGDEDDAAALRRRLAGVLANLPEALKRHLEALLQLESGSSRRASGGPPRWTGSPKSACRAGSPCAGWRGRCTARSRTGAERRRRPGRPRPHHRRNMRFDGVPFVPVTVRRAEDRPRLVVLADVSLSVRATARFTLHLVHGLQDLFTQVRSFAFVARIAETTELFRDHPAERALGLIFGGDVLDVDANSDYGTVFGEFIAEHASAVTRRTTVLVLGDARNNGNDPNLRAFEEIARRARDDLADTGAEVLLVPRQLRPARLRGVLRPGTGRARPGRAGTGGTRAGGRGGGQLSSPIGPDGPAHLGPCRPASSPSGTCPVGRYATATPALIPEYERIAGAEPSRLLTFHAPEIVFGIDSRGRKRRTPRCACALRPLLVTDPRLIQAGWVDELLGHLRPSASTPDCGAARRRTPRTTRSPPGMRWYSNARTTSSWW